MQKSNTLKLQQDAAFELYKKFVAKLDIHFHGRGGSIRKCDAQVENKQGIYVSIDQINTSLLKSHLQKCIRNAETEQLFFTLLLCHAPIHRVMSENAIRPCHKTWVTNVLNRICITCVEDVGIGSPIVMEQVYKLVQDFQKIRENRAKELEQLQLLHDISLVIANPHVKRSRLLSFLRAAYFLVPVTKPLIASIREQERYKEFYAFLDEKAESTNLKSFVKHFDAKSDVCFYYLFKVMFANDKSVKELKVDTKPYIEYAKSKNKIPQYKKTIDTLQELYNKHTLKEYWNFGAQIILLCLHQPAVVTVETNPETRKWYEVVPEVIQQTWRVSRKSLDRHVKGYKDHCDGSLTYFATTASSVVNEHATNVLYTELYVKHKEYVDANEKKKQEEKKSKSKKRKRNDDSEDASPKKKKRKAKKESSDDDNIDEDE